MWLLSLHMCIEGNIKNYEKVGMAVFVFAARVPWKWHAGERKYLCADRRENQCVDVYERQRRGEG